jgi:N-acetylmuramoyl-L-alanine amidase
MSLLKYRNFYLLLCLPFLPTVPSWAQVTGLSGWSIYLDPGHSRTENMGIYGYSEAEKTLRVGLHLREMLLTTTDIDTVFISRENDLVEVGLSQRTDEANALGAAWYHSIHSDAGSPEASSTLLLWGQYRDGREKIPNGGKAMSDIMVDLLSRGYRTGTRGSRGDCSFYGCTSEGPYLSVNRRSTMPSELSEASFHTNPRQNQLNMNAQWKRLEAKTFYWTFLKSHSIPRPFVGTCVGIVSDLESGLAINGAEVQMGGQTYTTDTYETLFQKYSNDPQQLRNGFYYFENLSHGTFEMILSAPGYFRDTTTVTLSDTFFTFKDVQLISQAAPFVRSTSPAQNDTNFAIYADPTITFSRRMNIASVEAVLNISPEVNHRYFWSNNNSVLRVEMDNLLEETVYTLTIGGSALGQYGQSLDGNGDGVAGDDFVLTFKTGPVDMTQPGLVGVYPPNRGTNVELRPIVSMIFNEPLDPGSIVSDIFELRSVVNNTLAAGALKYYPAGARSLLSFYPAQNLLAHESYAGKLKPGVKDVFGNAIPSEKNFSFTTGDISYRETVLDNFETGLEANWWEPQRSGSTIGIRTELTSRGGDQAITNLLTGSQNSLRVNYGWDSTAASWLIRVYLAAGSPFQATFGSDQILQTYVFGDGSGNQFRFAVDDNYPVLSTVNHEVSPWYTVDWLGWRLISWDMAQGGTGVWVGDGQLDGTLHFDSIQLTRVPGKATQGTFYFDDLRLAQKITVGVKEDLSAEPAHFELQQNYPNPFNPTTRIVYVLLHHSARVTLAIYDAQGRHIRKLVDGPQAAGQHVLQWDGRNAAGEPVASGNYIYQLDTGTHVQSRRMVLVR